MPRPTVFTCTFRFAQRDVTIARLQHLLTVII